MPIPPKMVKDTSNANRMSKGRHMRDARRKCSAQTLTHIHDGIDEHRDL